MKTTMRKKGKFADGSTKYILERNGETRTVFKPDKLWELHSPKETPSKPSQPPKGESEKTNQKFSHELLNEPSEEEINRTLAEISK